jgi:hypothetical protein
VRPSAWLIVPIWRANTKARRGGSARFANDDKCKIQEFCTKISRLIKKAFFVA